MSVVHLFEVTGSSALARPAAARTLNELSLELPQGVYTTFRTYTGARVLHLDRHFERLIESARLEGVTIHLDTAALRTAIAVANAATGFALARVRITIGLLRQTSIHVSIEELREPPEEVYRSGVTCGIADSEVRRDVPQSKSTRFIGLGARARESVPASNEVLLVNESGEILEGSSSNFFAVFDGVLRTAGESVLAGTTRAMVLTVAKGLLPIEFVPVLVDDVPRLQEAIITSVVRAVLPVIAIDERQVGNGVPGPYARELMQRFNRALEADLKPIVPC